MPKKTGPVSIRLKQKKYMGRTANRDTLRLHPWYVFAGNLPHQQLEDVRNSQWVLIPRLSVHQRLTVCACQVSWQRLAWLVSLTFPKTNHVRRSVYRSTMNYLHKLPRKGPRQQRGKRRQPPCQRVGKSPLAASRGKPGDAWTLPSGSKASTTNNAPST